MDRELMQTIREIIRELPIQEGGYKFLMMNNAEGGISLMSGDRVRMIKDFTRVGKDKKEFFEVLLSAVINICIQKPEYLELFKKDSKHIMDILRGTMNKGINENENQK